MCENGDFRIPEIAKTEEKEIVIDHRSSSIDHHRHRPLPSSIIARNLLADFSSAITDTFLVQTDFFPDKRPILEILAISRLPRLSSWRQKPR